MGTGKDRRGILCKANHETSPNVETMKSLIVTLLLVGTAVIGHGQGTIYFGNSALTRITILSGGATGQNVTAAMGYVFGAFYGPAGAGKEQLQLAPGLATIGVNDGVLSGANLVVFPLPGTAQGQVVSLQIRAWQGSFGTDWMAACRAGSYGGETDVRQVTLGPTEGPGSVIWQTATGTNPNRFTPLLIGVVGGPDPCIPEPSTLVLGALGAALLFLRWRTAGNR